MFNKMTNKQFILLAVEFCVAMALSFVLGTTVVKEPEVEIQEVVKYVEVIQHGNFDTSVLDGWDGDFSDGKIRMVGATSYGQDNNGDPIIIDEKGELWTLPGFEIEDEDFLLLWVADNNTSTYVHDDLILKVWIEKYETGSIEEVE